MVWAESYTIQHVRKSAMWLGDFQHCGGPPLKYSSAIFAISSPLESDVELKCCYHNFLTRDLPYPAILMSYLVSDTRGVPES
jgi:hypothetical protein